MHLNEQQLEAVSYGDFPLLILAGAGTGKTTTIVERIAYLINNDRVDSNQVLALTFSVDAAENLKIRLSDKDILNEFNVIYSDIEGGGWEGEGNINGRGNAAAW